MSPQQMNLSQETLDGMFTDLGKRETLINELQYQIGKRDARIAELEAKYEPKAAERAGKGQPS
jgi:hypothetical protein